MTSTKTVQVSVDPEHIRLGRPNSPWDCPISNALREAFRITKENSAREVIVSTQTAKIVAKDIAKSEYRGLTITLPLKVMRLLDSYDGVMDPTERGIMEPFDFTVEVPHDYPIGVQHAETDDPALAHPSSGGRENSPDVQPRSLCEVGQS